MSYLTITVSTPQLPYSQKRQAGRNRYDDPHVLNGYENGKADDYKKAQPHKRDHLAGVHGSSLLVLLEGNAKIDLALFLDLC